MASTAGGDTELANYYQRLGIAGYGVISSLAYWIPIMVLFFKMGKNNIKKTIWLGVILLLSYTVLQAQYTTQLALFVFALILALMGFEQFAKYKVLIVLVGILLLAIPSSVYANFAN